MIKKSEKERKNEKKIENVVVGYYQVCMREFPSHHNRWEVRKKLDEEQRCTYLVIWNIKGYRYEATPFTVKCK